MVGFEDPMGHVEQSETASVANEDGDEPLLPGFQLTAAGVRIALNRKWRPKPLLEIMRKGCGRSTFSSDTFLSTDFLEWPPQYYKLTPKM